MLPIRAAEFLRLHALETGLERLLVHEQRASGPRGIPGRSVGRLGFLLLPASVAEVDAGPAQLEQVLLLRTDETEFRDARGGSGIDLDRPRLHEQRSIVRALTLNVPAGDLNLTRVF